MARYRNASRALPIIFVFIIIVIAVVAMIALTRAVFFSGSSKTAKVDTSEQSLLDVSDGHSVSMTVRGPIVADEAFHSYTIDVSPSSRELTTYSGYEDTIVDQSSLPNNDAAYTQFVFALDKANLVKGTDDQSDIRGICASGRVYQFTIYNGGSPVKSLWTSTCSGSRGTLKANVGQLSTLFLNQIPNATDMTRRVGFNNI